MSGDQVLLRLLAALVLLLSGVNAQATTAAATAAPGGPCGLQANAVCPANQCCSQFGNCGVTADHCTAGCDAQWGSCGWEYVQSDMASATPPTTPSGWSPSPSPAPVATAANSTRAQSIDATVAERGGQCGPDVKAVCPEGQCCSESHYCGFTKAHCASNACDPAWGDCGLEFVPPEAPTNVDELKQEPDKNSKVAEPGGACGSKVDTICPGTQCCSNEGWCGVTADHCDPGKCNAPWGTCPGEPVPGPEPNKLDTKTIIGMVSAIVVGLGAIVAMAYTGWKWWHKRRGLIAAKTASTEGPQALPPVLMGVPRVKDVAAESGPRSWFKPQGSQKDNKPSRSESVQDSIV